MSLIILKSWFDHIIWPYSVYILASYRTVYVYMHFFFFNIYISIQIGIIWYHYVTGGRQKPMHKNTLIPLCLWIWASVCLRAGTRVSRCWAAHLGNVCQSGMIYEEMEVCLTACEWAATINDGRLYKGLRVCKWERRDGDIVIVLELKYCSPNAVNNSIRFVHECVCVCVCVCE